MLDALALWLATYLLHSTLLLSSAWLAARVVAHPTEWLWRAAVLGGLVTTTLHAGGHLPKLAYVALPGLPTEEARLASSETSRRLVVVAPPAAGAPSEVSPATRPSFVAGASTRSPEPATARAAAAGAAPAQWWRAAAVAWLVAAGAAIALLTSRTARLHWQLARRRGHARGETTSLLRDLARRADFRRDVRLTLAPAAPVPLARGWMRPEICLPRALESELSSEELEAALAHELAHLERHDPLWRAATRLVATLFSFQPLNRLACRALEEEAELCCDDRAATLTGRPVALARCLTRVAGWTAGERPSALPALAASGSTLRRRVLRLLEPAPRPASPRWSLALAILLPIAVVALTPGLGAAPPVPVPEAAAQAAIAPEPPDAPRAPEPPPIVHRLRMPVIATLRLPAAPPVPSAPTQPIAAEAPGAPPAPQAPMQLAAAEAPAAPATAEAHADAAETETETETEAEAVVVVEATESEVETGETEPAVGDDEVEEVEEAIEEVEAEIEAAMEAVEAAFETEIEAFEEAIEAQVDGLETEIERALEPLEQTLDDLDDDHEEALERGDVAAADAIARQMGELGTAMGELGSRLGALVSDAVVPSLGPHLEEAIEIQVAAMERLAEMQSDLAQRLAREIEERQRDGRPLDDDEIEALRAEMRRIAAESAPSEQEMQRLAREIEEGLAPTRARLLEMEDGMRREIEAWRERHHELLQRLEAQGSTRPAGAGDQSDDATPSSAPSRSR